MAVENLPLSTRTLNAVNRNIALFSARDLKLCDVLSEAGLGVRSVLEFACVVEAATGDPKETVESDQPGGAAAARGAQHTPSGVKSFFQLLAAYATGELGHKTLRAQLPEARDDWPQELRLLWEKIGELNAEELAGGLSERYAVATLLTRSIKPIDDRLKNVLESRVFSIGRPETLEEVGARFGVTRERIRQLEKKGKSILSRFHQKEFAPVSRTADRLGSLLGSARPFVEGEVESKVAELIADFDGMSEDASRFSIGLLPYLAGPYKVTKGWLCNDRKLPEKSRGELLARRDQRGLICDDHIHEALGGLGIREEFHHDWVSHLGKFTRVHNGIIHLTGTIADKAKSLIQFHGRPLTVDEMINNLGSKSVSSVRQRLIDDSRFWRINKQSEFVLAGTEGYDEYTGIVDEIVQELEECGGQASVNHLIAKLTTVYGVQESAVRAYLSTPMFARDSNGLVQVRDETEVIELKRDLSRTVGCYLKESGSWCWRVNVDKSLARGSGRPVPDAFADHVGCGVGDKIEIESDHGPIVFSWPSSSPMGASIGSLRQPVRDLGAEIGDFLFIAYSDNRLVISHLPENELTSSKSGLARLLLLVGRSHGLDEANWAKALASALAVHGDTDQERLAACRLKLESRGAKELAGLIEKPQLSVDEYLSSMEQLFKP